MHCLSNTYDYLFAKNYLPACRYFSNDGIHLSHSGIKRLLDAMNTTTKIVVDYELCVFSNFKTQNQNSHTGYSRRRNRGPQYKPYKPNRNVKAMEREAHRDTETLENNASDAIWSEISYPSVGT